MIPLLAILFTLLVLFLFVPFHLKLSGHYEKGFAGSFAVSWLWDLAGFDYSKDEIKILIAGRAILRKMRREKLREKGRKKPPKKERKGKSKSWILIHFPFVFETAGEFFRSLCPDGRIKGVVGLGDPAQTGMFMGILAACLSCLPLPFLTIVPEFKEERFNVEGWLSVRIVLVSIFALCMKFVLAREGREIIQEL
ncbi:MAG TPA: hypothetical protein VFG29_00905 [Syntrophales bacterium]|nr:hypothetical protein [Syntrophales bacterium]